MVVIAPANASIYDSGGEASWLSASGVAALATAVRIVGGAPLRVAEDRIGRRLAELLVALQRSDDDATTTALLGLVGYGPGLTPSGDDAILGLLCVLKRGHEPYDTSHLVPQPQTHASSGRSLPGEMWRGTRRRIVVTALEASLAPLLHRTTAVSIHQMRRAIAGSFPAAVSAVNEAATTMAGASDVRAPGAFLAAAVETLMGLGATSGADTIAGVLAGFQLLVALSVLSPRTGRGACEPGVSL